TDWSEGVKRLLFLKGRARSAQVPTRGDGPLDIHSPQVAELNQQLPEKWLMDGQGDVMTRPSGQVWPGFAGLGRDNWGFCRLTDGRITGARLAGMDVYTARKC
ncbi:MAG: hypothetical protein OXI38_13925, partial [Bacteroidota bacterium]|nr:hypothetical protein [Bacteroidota bacterium]